MAVVGLPLGPDVDTVFAENSPHGGLCDDHYSSLDFAQNFKLMHG